MKKKILGAILAAALLGAGFGCGTAYAYGYAIDGPYESYQG